MKEKKKTDVSDTKAERNIFQNVCEIKMYKHWYLRTGRLQMCWPEECWMKISGMLERSFTFIARKCVLLVFLHLFKRSLVSPVLPGPGREAWQQWQVKVFAGVLPCASRTKCCWPVTGVWALLVCLHGFQCYFQLQKEQFEVSPYPLDLYHNCIGPTSRVASSHVRGFEHGKSFFKKIT